MSDIDDIEIYDNSNIEEENCSLSNNTNTFESQNKNLDQEYFEILIGEVFQREALWNSLLPYKFRGPSETKTLWSEIDVYLGTPVGTSQTRWKNLRDRFVKEHTLQNTYIPSDSAAIKKKSSWPLYESLLFLVPTIAYRKTKSNIENVNPQINMLHFQENKECSSIVTKKKGKAMKDKTFHYNQYQKRKVY
ncbi:uncharacterized protein LOC120356763 [Solenopsis invicta]|uniref:uncharacterized protein LOC120356763 n=1 Tax=Solenopsis invicta TaxID=13686 RepID=UPI00193CAC64|nr:uncharacterized protein LOC120356763 [Solenopsis invicta]XP_039310323.1 uncharacterized protein LOC120356763 [Solenopsis invicta]